LFESYPPAGQTENGKRFCLLTGGHPREKNPSALAGKAHRYTDGPVGRKLAPQGASARGENAEDFFASPNYALGANSISRWQKEVSFEEGASRPWIEAFPAAGRRNVFVQQGGGREKGRKGSTAPPRVRPLCAQRRKTMARIVFARMKKKKCTVTLQIVSKTKFYDTTILEPPFFKHSSAKISRHLFEKAQSRRGSSCSGRGGAQFDSGARRE